MITTIFRIYIYLFFSQLYSVLHFLNCIKFDFISGIRNYQCPKCSKCLSSPSALYTHKKTHGEKTLQCDYCPKTFALKNYLKLHVKQVHEQSDRKHICHYCDKSFAYAGSLQVRISAAI